MLRRKWLNRIGWFVGYWAVAVAVMFTLGYLRRLILA